MVYIIILLITLFIASKAGLMNENITAVLMIPRHRLWVIIYLIILSLFFGYKTYQLFKKIKTRFPFQFMICISILFMIIGAFSQYNDTGNFTSKLHVYCCMSSTISFLVYEIIFFQQLKFENYDLYSSIFPYLKKLIEFLLLLLIVFGRINSYIEIIYIITVMLPLYLLEKNNFL